jgi:hypothetical protein
LRGDRAIGGASVHANTGSRTGKYAAPSSIRGRCVGDYELDVVVAGLVPVEIKSVEAIPPVFVAQMLMYLRATGRQTGLILNFNVDCLRNGVRRVVLRDRRIRQTPVPLTTEQNAGSRSRSRDGA